MMVFTMCDHRYTSKAIKFDDHTTVAAVDGDDNPQMFRFKSFISDIYFRHFSFDI